MSLRNPVLGALLAWFVVSVFVAPRFVAALDIDEAVAMAVESSPDVVDAVAAAERAAERIGSVFELDSVRFGLSGSYREQSAENDSDARPGGPGQPGDASPYSGSADVTLPIIPQLSMSGSVDTDFDGSVSVSLKPFARSNTYTKERGEYRKALSELETQILRTRSAAEKAALEYLSSLRRLALAEAELSLAEDSYEVTTKTYELGETTVDALRDAQSAVGAKRRAYFSARNRATDRTKALSLLLGPSVYDRSDSSIVEPLDLETLVSRVHERTAYTADMTQAAEYSPAVEMASIELESLEAQLRETWLWRPNLSIQGTVDLPAETVGVSASLSFSPSDLNDETRSDLEQSIRDIIETIEAERFALSLDIDAARSSVAIAHEALEAALLDLEQVSLIEAETELLFEQGERTELELREARLASKNSGAEAFEAAAGLLSAQNEYLLLFGETFE